MVAQTTTNPRQELFGGIEIVTMNKWNELKRRLQKYDPKTEMGKIVKVCFSWLPPDLAQELLDTIERCVIMTSQLELVLIRHPDSPLRHGGPLRTDLGVVSKRVVTTAGVTRLCVDWGNAMFDMKYMALGTGATAEAVGDTALVTEILATHYTSSVRPTCTHAESANTVPLVATHTQATAGDTINEHGIFNSATQGAVTLWDRSLTGAQTLSVGDGLQGTYTLTASAGG